MAESGHFILHCPKYDSLRNTCKSKFIAETVQELGKGTAAVRHILNPQYCKSVIHFLDDALNIRKSCTNKWVPVCILYCIILENCK